MALDPKKPLAWRNEGFYTNLLFLLDCSVWNYINMLN